MKKLLQKWLLPKSVDLVVRIESPENTVLFFSVRNVVDADNLRVVWNSLQENLYPMRVEMLPCGIELQNVITR